MRKINNNIKCKIFGHLIEARVYPDGKAVWGKPWGEPKFNFCCQRCFYNEDVKLTYHTTGRSESEGWEKATSSLNRKISVDYKELHFYTIAYKIKPRGDIVFWGDNTV